MRRRAIGSTWGLAIASLCVLGLISLSIWLPLPLFTKQQAFKVTQQLYLNQPNDGSALRSPQQQADELCRSAGQRMVRFHFSGEPVSFQRGEDVDVRVLSGGANEQRHKSFYLAVLVGALNRIFLPSETRLTGLLPISERKFADVLYRSSVCEKDREDAVAVVRKVVERAGFTFQAVGRCGGSGYAGKAGWNGRPGWTTECTECFQSKIMLSFERYTSGKTYLGEKLFLPPEYGAIAAYRGNGHEWMDLLTVNRKSLLDREIYHSDEEFAIAIVELLRNQTRMTEMQREEVFLDRVSASDRCKFFFSPLQVGGKGIPELYRYVNSEVGFRHLINKTVLRYWQTREPINEGALKILFNPERIEAAGPECADLEIDWCCP